MLEILDFYSDDCAPCKFIDRDLAIISNKIPMDIKKIDIYGMDNYPLIEKFNIMKVPTIIVLRDGLYVTGQVGYYGFDALSVFLEEANAI